MTPANMSKLVKISAAAKMRLKSKGFKGKERGCQTIAVEFIWRWKINNFDWYCGSKVVNERVRRKFQDLTNLLDACFLSDENMQNATHSEKWGIVGTSFPCLQLELLKHIYRKFQNTDQRYLCIKNRYDDVLYLMMMSFNVTTPSATVLPYAFEKMTGNYIFWDLMSGNYIFWEIMSGNYIF